MKVELQPTLIVADVFALLVDPAKYPSGVDVIRDAAAAKLSNARWPVYVADRPIGSSNYAWTIEKGGGLHPGANNVPSGCTETTLSIHAWGETSGDRGHSRTLEEAQALLKIVLVGMRRKLDTAFVGDCTALGEGIVADVRPEDGSDNWALRLSNRYSFIHSETSPAMYGV